MRELSVAEQRYQAVMAVISDGLSISQVAEKVGVSRQRYEAEGLEGLSGRSHRPARCPHQMPAAVEAALVELRRPGGQIPAKAPKRGHAIHESHQAEDGDTDPVSQHRASHVKTYRRFISPRRFG
jgi:transposase-like protein